MYRGGTERHPRRAKSGINVHRVHVVERSGSHSHGVRHGCGFRQSKAADDSPSDRLHGSGRRSDP